MTAPTPEEIARIAKGNHRSMPPALPLVGRRWHPHGGLCLIADGTEAGLNAILVAAKLTEQRDG